MIKFKIKNFRLYYLREGAYNLVNWFDIRTKLKSLLRKIFYSQVAQNIICNLVISYLYLVYFTSRVSFVNLEVILNSLHKNSPIIFSCWHNRLLLSPFLGQKIRQNLPQAKFMALASKHGDGKFIGKIVEKMGTKAIYGSTRGNRKSSRGIDFSSMRELLDNLKNGYCLGITPDGPRGPAKQINGQLLQIARISGAKLASVSISFSRKIEVNSWDKMKIPLPFSRICFVVDEEIIGIDKDASDGEIDSLEEKMRHILNRCEKKADELMKF